MNEYQTAWRARNIDRVREQGRKTAAKRKDGMAVYRHLRRASGQLNKGDVGRLHALQKGCCAICRDQLNGAWEIDHVQPIKKGGKTLFTNLQLLCRTCNRSKGARDPIEHMQRVGFLL